MSCPCGCGRSGRRRSARRRARIRGAEDRKGVAVEGEAEAERGRLGAQASRPAWCRGLGGDPEAVAAVGAPGRLRRWCRPSARWWHVGRDVFAVVGLDDFAAAADYVDPQVVLGLVAVDREGEARHAVAEVKGLWGVVSAEARLWRRRWAPGWAADRLLGGGGLPSGSARPRSSPPRRCRQRRASSATARMSQICRDVRDGGIPFVHRSASLSFACGVSCRARAERAALRIVFVRFAPETCNGLFGSSAPDRMFRTGFGIAGAAV